MSILADALEAAHNGKHAAAVQLFKKLPSNLKLTPQQLYSWGASHYTLGERQQAIHKFVAVLRADRDHYPARNALGLCLWEVRKPRLSLVHLKRAVEIRPHEPTAWVNMGSAYQQMEDHRSALKCFERAHRESGSGGTEEEKKNHLSVLYYNWAKSLTSDGTIELAMEKYSGAIALNPDFFLAHHNLALLQWESGAYSDARNSWRLAYAIYKQRLNEPVFRRENAQYAGFILLFALNDHEQAERELLSAREAHPKSLQIISNLASLYLERSEVRRFESARSARQSARRLLGAALEMWEATPAASRSSDQIFSMAQLLSAFGQRDRAIALLTKAPEKVQCSARISALLGSAYLAQGAHTQAIVHLRAALAGRPQQATRIDLANALRKTGAKDEAERELKQLLNEAPYNLDALIALGDLYAEMPDDGTEYFTELAVRNYSLALYKTGWDDASRPLNTRRLAEVLYARAVERQKLLRLYRYGPLGVEAEREVRQDLEQALKNDPDHPRALHALKKLRDIEQKSHTSLYAAAPWIIALFSAWLFCMAQVSFFSRTTAVRIGASEYSLISFGAVLFFTAGCLLPTILRLKFASFELEVSPEPRTRSDEYIALARA